MRRALALGILAWMATPGALTGTAKAGERYTGPWDMQDLARPPKVEWIERPNPIGSLYYAGEPYRGKPTRVFAFCGVPESTAEKGKRPAMVLVHGGGGTAFREWVEIWVKRGYVAIAMDLAGKRPDKTRLPDGGPDQSHQQKFTDLAEGVKTAWTYHAVANVVRAVSLLESLPVVDRQRIGITGISWGGYLTCLVAGLDGRLKAAVPVYGCGFLHENSAWLKSFERLGPKLTKAWVENFDPSQYLAGAEMPMLFVNGTNDSAYPLDSHQKSYRLVKGLRTLCITVRMPHSHPAGWRPQEIGLFIDSVLKGGKPLARIAEQSRDGKAVTVKFKAAVPIRGAALHYATNTGEWKTRDWKFAPAEIKGDTANAVLPAVSGIVYFLTLTDDRGAVVSTEHQVIDGRSESR